MQLNVFIYCTSWNFHFGFNFADHTKQKFIILEVNFFSIEYVAQVKIIEIKN